MFCRVWYSVPRSDCFMYSWLKRVCTVAFQSDSMHPCVCLLHPKVPRSVALPFGTFEKVIADPANAAAAKSLASLLKELSSAPVGGGVPAQLAALRKLVATELKAPKALVQVRVSFDC